MRGVRTLVLAVAVGLSSAAPASAADHAVGFQNFQYDPSDITIAVHDTVTFSGQNGATFTDHPLVWSATGEKTDSGTSKTFTFDHPGTYAYFCAIHVDTRGMKGVIRIPDQHPARVAFAVSPSPRAGQPVTFTYSGDADPDGSLVRWDWDLDGDGTFETSTPVGAVTTTYASARTVTVGMRALDDSGEASATATQAVTIAPAGAGGAGGGGGAGSGASRDTTAPRASALKLSGLKLSLRASERATATATLRARGKTIARGAAKTRSRAITIRLKLTKAGRALLPHGAKRKATLTLTLRDAAGNRRTIRRSLTVRRP